MNPSELEARVAALETEVASLKRLSRGSPEDQPWWDRIAGTFAKDPAFVEAMRLGREYRESTFPDFDALPNAEIFNRALGTKDETIAGNGGDLVKHTVYLAILAYLTQHDPWKDGIRLRECHAGKGFYRVEDQQKKPLHRLFEPIDSADGPSLHKVQREIQLDLGTWPTLPDAPSRFYAGSAALNAWALGRGSRESNHRLELYEKDPGTRASLRDLFAVLEALLAGLEVAILPEPEVGQPFDGEVFIQQTMGQWGTEDIVLLDPFGIWAGKSHRARRRTYRRIFEHLSDADPSSMPSLLMFWTWGSRHAGTAKRELGEIDGPRVEDGYRDLRSLLSGRGKRFIRISWVWKSHFAMWILVPDRHLDPLKSVIEIECEALREHLAANGPRKPFKVPPISVAIE